jgi:hypothetical protein
MLSTILDSIYDNCITAPYTIVKCSTKVKEEHTSEEQHHSLPHVVGRVGCVTPEHILYGKGSSQTNLPQ